MLRHSIISVVLFSLLLFACKQKDNNLLERKFPVVKVKTESPKKEDMSDTIKIYGEIKIRNEAHAASQFEGRLENFTKLPGDKVRKGERIGTVIPAEREALLQVTNDIEDSLRYLLDNQMQPIPLFSPIDGIVLSVKNHTGDLIQKGETIMHLGNLSILDVYADLPVKYLHLVRKMKYMNLKFLSYKHPDMRLPIRSISGNVDPAKQTITTRLELKNPKHEFHPGMLTLLYFPSVIHKDAVTVSRNVVIEEEGVFSVFVLNGNKVEKRKVKVGIFNNNRVEIVSGLSERDLIVSDKAYSLTDGMEVSR
ncbi:Probable Co/Zn/Cd efflux system membrane fusion protein [hydrothermal vent metagenome]|uniref:Probable Co/Zn/Cd efflux system membrane fusion protein n=1 Tax=hydrothermal vent metagenome TaxID=652676 RepID=A0A3B1CBQ4_9ZZZZ